MLVRNDQPGGFGFNFGAGSSFNAGFNFGVDSVFNSTEVMQAETIPILPNQFLLLDSPLDFFLLLDGTDLLLLGT